MTEYALSLIEYLERNGFSRLEAEFFLDENARENWREAQALEAACVELNFEGDEDE